MYLKALNFSNHKQARHAYEKKQRNQKTKPQTIHNNGNTDTVECPLYMLMIKYQIALSLLIYLYIYRKHQMTKMNVNVMKTDFLTRSQMHPVGIRI